MGEVLHLNRKPLAPKYLPYTITTYLGLGRLLVKMVDFQNPSVIENDFRACTSQHYASLDSPLNSSFVVGLIKLWHVLGGIFM